MTAILILSGPYSSCHATEIIWQTACDKHKVKLEIYDLSTEQGKYYELKLKLKSFPSLIFKNKVMAVGHPDQQTAEKIISTLEK